MIEIIRSRRGVSIVELLVAMAILGAITVLIAPFFTLTQRGFSSMEAHNSLKTGNQEAINRIGNKLSQCKKLFENTPDSKNFLARAVLTTQPLVLTGSLLPIIGDTASLSPGATGFVAGNVGNSLFFASIEAPKDFVILDSSGSPSQARIDNYMFNYYFLAEDPSVQIQGQSKLILWEWHSQKYADQIQIMTITDVTKRSNLIQALIASGTAAAWDPSAKTATTAFYALNGAGILDPEPDHAIEEASAAPMIVLVTGLTMGGYKYGISPNTGLAFASPKTVPSFAAATGKFPSGFEVTITGPNSARQVLMRLVLVAQGSFKGIVADEQIVLTTARDLW